MKLTPEEVAAWSDPAQKPLLSAEDAVYALHTFGPRARFVKTLPPGASVLDAGAGDGTSIVFKTWPAPARADLRMFAWAGDKGSHFEQFEGHEVGFWPQNPPDFGGRTFDAIMSCNFLEHIESPLKFLQLCGDRVASKGRLYLEWPRVESIGLPSTRELAAAGVGVMTGRYDDDYTHRADLPLYDDVAAALVDAGFAISEHGIARVPMVDQQVAIHARRANDIVGMTLAYWSLTGWCQYLTADRN